MKTQKVFILVLLVFTYLSSLNGQKWLKVISKAPDGEISIAKVSNTDSLPKFENSISLLKEVLKTNSNTDFYLYRIVIDKMGMIHEKYQQTFKGLKVEFREFIVHKNKFGKIISINGDFLRIPDNFNSTSKLRFQDAFDLLNSLKNGPKYKAFKLPEGQRIGIPITELENFSETVVIKGDDGNLHLAYKGNLSSDRDFGNFYGYLDCETGALIFKQPLRSFSPSIGTAATRFSENVNITTDYNGVNYVLKETSRNNSGTSIQTFNYNDSTAENSDEIEIGIITASSFSDNDNDWTAPEHYTDLSALDVYWGLETAFDYFLSEHSRNSYDDNEGPIRGYVHVSKHDGNNHVPFTNAFWDFPTKACFFGESDPLDPYVSLDIVAHEFGHGVNDLSVGESGFVYSKGSGALSESLADIWGACIENWAPLNPNDINKNVWLFGEERSAGPNRSLSYPNLFSQPDTYLGVNWFNYNQCTPVYENDFCGVHKNSGVGNFWFYLLVNGGDGINDNNEPYHVQGIGFSKASQIVYQCVTTSFTPNTDFVAARDASYFVTQSLFPNSMCELISVINAWHAVGIGDPYEISTSGTDIICSSSNSTFTLESCPEDYSINWTKSSNLEYISGQGTSSYTVRAVSSYGIGGPGWIQATLTSNCGSYNLTPKTVWVGAPLIVSESPLAYYDGSTYNDVCNSQQTTTDFITGGVSSVQWYRIAATPSNTSWSQIGMNLSFYFYSINQTAVYTVSGTNVCGTTSYDFGFKSIDCGGGGCDIMYSISPNPSKDKIKIIPNIPPPCDLSSRVSQNGDISLFDKQGTLKKKLKYTFNSVIEIDLSDLKNGVYIVEIFDGISITRKTIIVNH